MALAVAVLTLVAAPALAQEYGAITGIVTSANNAAVPDATVTLHAVVDGAEAQAVVVNNPQRTSNFSSSLPGAYVFIGVPYGKYNVTAMWDGRSYSTEVNLTGGTATANIVIPEYIDVMAIRQAMPVPTPRTYYTYVPVRLASPLPQATAAKSPGLEAPVALLAILMAMAVKRRLER
jgi:hypothetical protein